MAISAKTEFNHIFVVNPGKFFNFDELKNFCYSENFPLSKIYLFGTDRKYKSYMKNNLLPYFLFDTKKNDIAKVISEYKTVFNLIGQYYTIIDDCLEPVQVLRGFRKYLGDINILKIPVNTYGNKYNQNYLFDFLTHKHFRLFYKEVKNHYQKWTTWQRY